MTDWLVLLLALIAGMALGIFFFGGLWWTVRHGLSMRFPALLFPASLLLRLGVTVVGFYLVADGDWQRLIACLVGFMLARWLVSRWTRGQAENMADEQVEQRWN